MDRALPLLGVGLSVLVGLIVALIGLTTTDFLDGEVYYEAGLAVANGQTPYTDPSRTEVFRYAPWFAYAWVPLTWLPRELVMDAWRIVMGGCALVAVLPLLRMRDPAAYALAALVGGYGLNAAGYGQVTPLMIAALTLTRCHPVAVGIFASLKLHPILLCAGYIAERRWRDAVVAVAVALVLWAPVVAFDLSGFRTAYPAVGLPTFAPVVWLVGGMVTALVTLYLVVKRSRWAWIGTGIGLSLFLPALSPAYLAPVIVTFLRPAGSPAARWSLGSWRRTSADPAPLR